MWKLCLALLGSAGARIPLVHQNLKRLLQAPALSPTKPCLGRLSGSLSGTWRSRLRACTRQGHRYVIQAPALQERLEWQLQAVSLGGEAPTVWPSSNLSLLALCVPSFCSRSGELLEWQRGARSHILLRLHHPTQALAVEELKGRLARTQPEWYLRPWRWPARPPWVAFQVRSATRHFFDFQWGLFTTRMQVISKRRAVFCAIPKVGLTQFYMLMQRLGGRNASYQDFLEPRDRGEDRLAAWFASADYWKDHRWKLLTFVRDPLERFLSAFMDKCLEDSTHCGLDLPWPVSLQSSREDQVAAFRWFAAATPGEKMLTNDHWILQSHYILHGCGFIWQRLDFVGLLSSEKPSVNYQATRRSSRATRLRFGACCTVSWASPGKPPWAWRSNTFPAWASRMHGPRNIPRPSVPRRASSRSSTIRTGAAVPFSGL